jgi:hypothetical protein
VRVQLKTSAGRIIRSWPLLLVLVVGLFLASTLVARATGAAPRSKKHLDVDETSEQRPEDAEPKVEGTANEHVGGEFAVYTDTDHVTVVTPSINAGIENIGGVALSGSYLADVVSAASADIVSTASSRWQEVRHAGTLSATYKPYDFGVSAGGSISSEPDYLSYGVSAALLKEFDHKNWTVTFGYGFSHDTAGRCGTGSVCTPFSVFSRNLQRGAFNAGLAWVIDRDSLASLNADLIIENGDQSKVYRYIAMFAPSVAEAVPAGASIDFVNANRLPERPLEQLPLSRVRFAATGRYARRLEDSTLRLEERVYDDSWGLVASTTDAKWIFDFGRRVELWPHTRIHAQSSVSFWKRAYASQSTFGWDLPKYRTGDRELGPLSTVEGGLGARFYLGPEAEPRGWQIGLTVDAMYTSFPDDLFVTSRTALLGTMTSQVQW